MRVVWAGEGELAVCWSRAVAARGGGGPPAGGGAAGAPLPLHTLLLQPGLPHWSPHAPPSPLTWLVAWCSPHRPSPSLLAPGSASTRPARQTTMRTPPAALQLPHSNHSRGLRWPHSIPASRLQLAGCGAGGGRLATERTQCGGRRN